jgi:hypothetical protein
MSVALQLLVGGFLFAAADWVAGPAGVAVLAAVLIVAELWHDLQLFRMAGR